MSVIDTHNHFRLFYHLYIYIYLFNKITVGLNNALNAASSEYLRDGGHQAGLGDIGMSLKFVP